jgi:ribosomal protein S18 acetylase RimI-like enzyme
MIPADLPAVIATAALVHPEHPEDDAVLAERLALAPEGCLVLERSGAVLGYALSHPWAGPPPALNRLLGGVPARPQAWYVHDLAILPGARGGGEGAAGAALLLARADGLGLPALLVAVSGSAPFWARLGFRAVAAAGASYGADAVVMRREPSRGRG